MASELDMLFLPDYTSEQWGDPRRFRATSPADMNVNRVEGPLLRKLTVPKHYLVIQLSEFLVPLYISLTLLPTRRARRRRLTNGGPFTIHEYLLLGSRRSMRLQLQLSVNVSAGAVVLLRTFLSVL